MITKFSDAREKYLDLFAEATERLHLLNIPNSNNVVYGTNGAKIESLEEYFSNLRNLIYGHNEYTDPSTVFSVEDGYKFLKLPLDEPHFKIDANTRQIEVPDEFRKNGISVLGDEVAEILFFEVDRYYDATDLSTTKIIIQWQAPNSPSIQYTPAFAETVITDPLTGDDKVVFGWPITSTITAASGTVTFSVRFYIENSVNASDEPLFSLSTLTQKAVINPGLAQSIIGLSLDDRLSFVLDRRIKNSPPGTPDDPVVPVWIFFTPQGTEPIVDNTVYIDYQVPESGLTMALLGYKIDSGSLSYAWKRDGELLRDFISPISDEGGAYIPVEQYIEDSTRNIKIATYYYVNYENNYIQLIIGSSTDFEQRKKDFGTLYVRCSQYTLEKKEACPGTYYAAIKNTLYNKEAIDDPEKRIKWVILPTQAPVITSTTWDEDMSDEDEIRQKVIDKNNTTFEMRVLDGENLTDNTVYIWEKSADKIITAEPSNYEMVSNNIFYVPTEEGYYRVRVVNERNNSTQEAQTKALLVLFPIADFTLATHVSNLPDEDGNVELTVMTSRELFDFESVSYVWSLEVDGGTTIIPEVTGDTYKVPATADVSKYSVRATLSKGTQTAVQIATFNKF